MIYKEGWSHRLERDNIKQNEDRARSSGAEKEEKMFDYSAQHPFKSAFVKYYKTRYKQLLIQHYYNIFRSNWFSGRSTNRSFPAHGGAVVTSILFHNDRIITASDDSQIHIHDIHSGLLKRRLVEHTGGVWCLQTCTIPPQVVKQQRVSEELERRAANTLVSGSTDRTLRVWDLNRGKCIAVVSGHSSTVRCLVVAHPPRTALKNSSPIKGKIYFISLILVIIN